MTRQRFTVTGAALIEPSALGQEYGPAAVCSTPLSAGVGLVTVDGPLMQRMDPCFDSYESVLTRARIAFEGPQPCVVLRLSSPGGVVDGAFSCARQLRAMAKASGKPLIAYVDESACSAAYAIACAADSIVVPSTGRVGSVGVILEFLNVSAAMATQGVQPIVITSGERKADGNPGLPVDDASRAAIQAHVDTMAQAFFALVNEMRPQLSSASVAGYQAAVYYGDHAVKAGLADFVAELPDVLADPQKYVKGTQTMPKEELMAALKALADSGDASAARMLAAADEPAPDDKEKVAAKAADEAPAEPAKDEPASDAKATAKVMAALVTQVSALTAEAEATKRAALFTGVDPQIAKALAATPLAQIPAILAAIPKAQLLAPAAASVQPTVRGETQNAGGAPQLPPDAKASMDLAMGLVETQRVAVHDPVTGTLALGVIQPKGQK